MKFEHLKDEASILAVVEHHNSSANTAYVVVDTETTSKNPLVATLVNVQMTGVEPESAVLFDAEFAHLLLKLDRRIKIVAHYFKYDVHVLLRHGVDMRDYVWWDTILLGHLVDENRLSYSLDSYVSELWGDNYKKDFWEKYKSYQEAPADEALEYACKDIFYTGRLYEVLLGSLEEEQVPESLVNDANLLQMALLNTEIAGIKVDVPYLEKIGCDLRVKISDSLGKLNSMGEAELYSVTLGMWLKEMDKRKTPKGKAGVPRPVFNWSSSHQVASLLYEELGLPVQKTKGAISTDYDSLVKLKDLHPLVPILLEYREYPVVYNTFILGTLEKMVNGRIHPKFNINGTKGARISHSDPNMGNIPASGGVKGIFVPEEGYVFCELDYGQLEVCIEAHLTGDKNLLEIVQGGASKHDITAKGLGIPRPLAKTVNFAMQYWCGPDKVAKILGCSKKDGQLAWNKFWETYPGPKKLKAETDKLIDDGFPITDMFGRKRRFEYRKRSHWDSDYRSGYNFIVQSSGGQMMNNAAYKSDQLLRKFKIGHLVLTVHDSGLMTFLKGSMLTGAAIVEEQMVNEGKLAGLNFALTVSVSNGMTRWGDK